MSINLFSQKEDSVKTKSWQFNPYELGNPYVNRSEYTGCFIKQPLKKDFFFRIFFNPKKAGSDFHHFLFIDCQRSGAKCRLTGSRNGPARIDKNPALPGIISYRAPLELSHDQPV
jgi:hypothetical protein